MRAPAGSAPPVGGSGPLADAEAEGGPGRHRSERGRHQGADRDDGRLPRVLGVRGESVPGLPAARRGAPVLAVGDGALGLWNALNKVFPEPGIRGAGFTRRPTVSTASEVGPACGEEGYPGQVECAQAHWRGRERTSSRRPRAGRSPFRTRGARRTPQAPSGMSNHPFTSPAAISGGGPCCRW